MGPDYVIRTVADGDPLDYSAAQQLVTDAIFESLMPLYCALPHQTRIGCVTNRVQWNLLTYDAGGNPKLSGSPVSGPAYHYLGSCSRTPQERIGQLVVWVNVDLAAGILDLADSQRLILRLNAALGQLDRGHLQGASARVKRFLDDVQTLVEAGGLPAAAGEPLVTGAAAVIAQLGN